MGFLRVQGRARYRRKLSADAATGSSSNAPATANSASHRQPSPNSSLPAAAAIPTRVRDQQPGLQAVEPAVLQQRRARITDDDGSCSEVSAARSPRLRSSQ